MKIEFFVPPASKSIGGIERAILGFERALGARHEIRRSFEDQPEKDTQLVHFHGLWDKDHLRPYRHCQRCQIPYIVSPHGMLEPWAYRNRRWKKWAWMKLFGQRQLDGAACVLATSQMEAGHLKDFTNKTKIAPLGLDDSVEIDRTGAREKLGIGPEDKVVLYLSRIDRKKGLDLLVRAIADHPHVQLWIVGDGDAGFTNELKAVHSSQIRWVGAIWGDERWDYLAAADLFCLPTHSENFGFGILEALWVGTPTLTTNKTPWVEHEDVDGLHICDDTLGSLRQSLGRILPTLERPRGIDRWAHANFHLDHLADTYDEIYAAAVEQ